ncbi:uncharacterized protein M421DRAFT_389290 [Didymella exigua CBS 183.55]|uniref:Uncharacterized protein n=1 Tax=Didymella exigua CBS 183.55 TaxID=1150837 RepID=A0A6A5RMB5_9PLEO|nr:uncharacterized protein M421DRAFT_389290 [Didymella exigua CBS 183.55]KAF1929565.1 hypothetical protein M421DRAFT_389290 [Didymella exigua CBS 183.55]
MAVVTAGVVDETLGLLCRGVVCGGPGAGKAYAAARQWQQARSGNVQRNKGAGVWRDERCRARCHCGAMLLRVCDWASALCKQATSVWSEGLAGRPRVFRVWAAKSAKFAGRKEELGHAHTGLTAPAKGSMVQIYLVWRLTAERPGSDHKMSVGGAAKQKDEDVAPRTGKGFTRRALSKARTSNHTHGGEPSSKRHSGSQRLSALTPAHVGCCRWSIWAAWSLARKSSWHGSGLWALGSSLSFDAALAVCPSLAALLSLLPLRRYETVE